MDADVIVIGAGVNGLWSAHHLAAQGIKSIVLEQYPLPHTMGSSHGQSRLTRSSYVAGIYADIAPESHNSWNKLQDETGREIYLPMDVFVLSNIKERGSLIEQSIGNLQRMKIDFEVVEGENVEKRFPGLSSRKGFRGVLDKEARLLKADSCLLALQEWYKQHGGIIHDAEQVTGLKVVSNDEIKIFTKKKTYTSKSVILTCGPYINHILSLVSLKIPVEPVRALVYYWTDKCGGKYDLSNNFPSTIIYPPGHTYLYTLPAFEYPGLMKICYHCEASINPYQRDKVSVEEQIAEKKKLEWLKTEIINYFPDIDASDPAVTETCMLTESLDKQFIIDYHPKYRNIVIGSGFSGRGFQPAPVIGRTLAAMATGQPTPYRTDVFSLDRFKQKPKL